MECAKELMFEKEPPQDLSCPRIGRMRRRFQTDVPKISIERARYFTASWKATQDRDLPVEERVAMAMKNVYEKMTINVDDDDRVVGAWTEFALGWPMDIERGLFNGVLDTELDKGSMIVYQVRSYLKFLVYLVGKYGPIGMVRNLIKSAKMGPTPVNVGAQTMSERKINAFAIRPADKRELKDELLPYWRGRCVADVVADELERSGVFTGDMARFVDAVPATPSKQVLVISIAAALATYQGHLILDHRQVLQHGLLAMKRTVDEKLDACANDDSQARAFYQAASIALSGVIVFAQRLAEAVEVKGREASDPQTKSAFESLAKICRRVPLHPAQSYREAVQALWTQRLAVEIAHVSNVHAPGRLDQILDPYYRKDAKAGKITREQARELLEEFLLKVMTQNMRPESNFLGNFYLRYEGSTPITLGGLTPQGDDATNEMTEIILEAADRSKSVTSVVVRVHRNTPEHLYDKMAEILYRGTSNLSMMNDDVFVGAMRRYGFSKTDALNYAITGCTDLICPGKTGGISFSGLLLGHVLDMALRNGDAQTLIGSLQGAGPRTGQPEQLTSFEALLEAFFKQADHQIRVNVEASNLRDRLFAERMPAPVISVFIDGCMEKGRDVTRGGAVYDYSGINIINSVANVVDSLYVIKKLVYDEKRFTLSEILTAVDDNYAGHEPIKQAIDAVQGKWGNANVESDELARRVTTELFKTCATHRAYRNGGPFVPFINSMTSHTLDGRVSVATPDGRKAATPYAASCNPYNVEKAGLTGVLRSVAALDFDRILGCAVNVKLHPSGIGRTEAARRKWSSLIKTYFDMGGAQIQPTVASIKMLRAAQQDPDRYRDLIVKVGGYSTYFVDLGHEIQNEVIARTEHGGAT